MAWLRSINAIELVQVADAIFRGSVDLRFQRALKGPDETASQWRLCRLGLETGG